jgi:hypothetical protein
MWDSFISATKEVLLSGSPSAVFVWVFTAINISIIYLISVMCINQRITIKKYNRSVDAVDQIIRIIEQKCWEHYKILVFELKLGNDFLTSLEAVHYGLLIKEDLKHIKQNMIDRIENGEIDARTNGELWKWASKEIESDIKCSNRFFDEHHHPSSIITRKQMAKHYKKLEDNVRELAQIFYADMEILINKFKLKKWFFLEVNIK